MKTVALLKIWSKYDKIYLAECVQAPNINQ